MYLTRAIDIIDDSVLSLSGSTHLDNVNQIVDQSGIHRQYIAVTGSHGQLLGVVDYPLNFDPGLGQALESYVVHLPVTLGDEKTANDAVKFMLSHGHEHVAVTARNRFVGLITRSSVISAFGEVVAS